MPSQRLVNGDLEEDETGNLERPEDGVKGLASLPAASSAVAIETLEPDLDATEGRSSTLKQRPATGGHPCAQCDRVFMSMQGLRSHERSHSAMAMIIREDKYSCQYCQFVSPFRHK